MFEVRIRDYHKARELRDAKGMPTGRWMYSCLVDGQLLPFGYCSSLCMHLSQEDAERHFLEFVLDTATFDGRWRGVEYRCEICDTWTDRFAQTSLFAIYRLCLTHLDRAGLAACVRRDFPHLLPASLLDVG